MAAVAGSEMVAASDEVFGTEDVLALILMHATHAHPWTFVVAGRVCKAWRTLCRRDASLALAATRSVPRLTKNVLMGMLCLCSGEADSIPRHIAARQGGGIAYMYDPCMVDDIWIHFVGSVANWHGRLAARERRQRTVERAFGAEWRVKQYPINWIRLTGAPCRVY